MGVDREEEVPVPPRLGEDEGDVEREGGDRREGELAGVNSGPAAPVVKVGRTRHSVATAVTVARALPVPSLLKTTSPWRSEPTRMEIPTMPLTVIIVAAKTVSGRGSPHPPCPTP